jgi:hypothetical protein
VDALLRSSCLTVFDGLVGNVRPERPKYGLFSQVWWETYVPSRLNIGGFAPLVGNVRSEILKAD